jgi:hypothetical protein
VPPPVLVRCLAVALALTATAACPGPNNGGGSTTTCDPGSFPEDAGAPGAGALSLVVGAEDTAQSHVAVVWQSGDRVALVHGGQGGFMIRPSLDVTALAPLVETAGRACFGVRMTPADPADAGPTTLGVMARRVAGTTATYHILALFGLLSYGRSVDGVSVGVTLDVHAPQGDGRAQLTVVPDSTIAY